MLPNIFYKRATFILLTLVILLCYILITRGIPSDGFVEKGVQAIIGNLTLNEKDESHSLYNTLAKYGSPQENNVIKKYPFLVCYSTRFRIPLWTIERLTPDMILGKKSAKRSNNFKIDELIPESFRSTPKDYLKSGYDKSHLAAAENYRSSQEAMNVTFFTVNIVPMEKSVNRGIWRTLENRARTFTRIYGNVYIMSGCLFLDGPKGFLFESRVAIPTHFFKVIVGVVDEGLFDIESYIIPNEPQPKSPIIENYLITKNELEYYAGYIIFVGATNFRHTNDTTAFKQLLSSARLTMIENDEVLYSTMPSSSA